MTWASPSDEPRRQVVRPFRDWLHQTIGAEHVCFYVWDQALGRCLPVWTDAGAREWGSRVERVLTPLVDQVLVTVETSVDLICDDARHGPLAPEGLRNLTLLPFFAGAEPLGVLAILNADARRLETHRATLNLLASPTLLALRSLWDVRQVTLQNQELQRSKGYLLALLKEIEQRQFVIEQLTQEVKRTRGPLEGIFENAPVALITLDRSGTVQSANQPAADLFGQPQAQMINRPIGDLLPRAVHKEIEPLFRRALAGETMKLPETFWPGADGRVVMLTLYPFRDERGEILGVVGILPDVTEDVRMRRELTRAEKLVALGEMIAGVAHEMNNPLTSVLGYSSLLLQSVMDPAVRGPLEIIAKEAERTARIVQNLLVYARQHRPERRPTRVNELLNQALEQRAEALAASRIAVRRVFDAGVGMVRADPFQLQQVFLNLIINAEQAIREIREEGHLTVRTFTNASSGQVVVEVEDDGPGIPETHLSRVFDPFFTTKEVGKGTGLGLSICYGTIKEHDGRILVRNRPGGGAIFTVELPLQSGEVTEETVPREVSQELLYQKRILVVDDEPHICRFFQQALALFRCQVEVASSLREALNKVRGQSYDLVIYDYRLLDGTGEELAQEILKLDPALADRMLLITGDSLTVETRDYLRGAPNVLLKPFDLTTLLAALQNILAPKVKADR